MKSRQDAKYEKEIRDEIEKLKRKAMFIGVISTLIVLILSVDQYFIFSTKTTDAKDVDLSNVKLNMSGYTLPRKEIRKMTLSPGSAPATTGATFESALEGGTSSGTDFCYRGTTWQDLGSATIFLQWPFSYVHQVKILFPNQDAERDKVITIEVCTGIFCTHTRCESLTLTGTSEWRSSLCNHPGDSIRISTTGDLLSLCQVEVYGFDYE